VRLQPENRPKDAHAGLYIHIPFCVRKCPYCDFFSITELVEMEAFIDVLKQEMHLVTMPEMVFDTIYIGGGTPSLLKPFQLMGVLQKAYTQFRFAPDLEVTMEVNPGTVCLDSLKTFVNEGVNRVNLGIQSFDDRRLGFLGRLHSAREGREAVRLAREAGMENLGFDLIYGLPNQTPKDWLKDLKEAAGYEPEHVSCYMLTYEEGTPLHGWRKAGKFRPLSEDGVRDLFEVTIDFLADKGYEQYEISNFARGKALRSRHNQKYWRHAPYIGLGPSAHSFVEPKRWWNQGNLSRYFQSVLRGELPVEGMEQLNKDQLVLESVFLGLRTSDGVDTLEFTRRHHLDFLDLFGGLIERLQAQGLLSVSLGRCRLTREGMIFSDTISGLFAEHIRE
jgi:oxygen-independent coproporphyrinogen-3 oxidase